jgi:magnesium chelatase family protein
LIDRIDLFVPVEREGANELNAVPLTSSKAARERIVEARERQAARLSAECVSLNAHMDSSMLGRHVRLDSGGEAMMRCAREQGLLSTRGQHRLLRVARTIADLSGSSRVRARDLGAALALRPEVALSASRAA